MNDVRAQIVRKSHPDIILKDPPIAISMSDSNGAQETKRPRRHGSFPINELRKHDSIDIKDVPEWNPSGQFAKRRWQPLSEEVIELSSRGRALPVDVPMGIDPDVVQSGMREEMKRLKYRLHTRKIANIDGSMTMYFFGEPAG